MNKKISTGVGIAIIVIVAIAIALGIILISQEKNTKTAPNIAPQQKVITPPNQPSAVGENGKQKACLDSGGIVATSSCCGQTQDFPNNCAIGACGCAPASSHQVKTCDCGAGKCFGGSSCISNSPQSENGAGVISKSQKDDNPREVCKKIEDDINNMLDLAKSCSQDSDCISVKKYEACPFSCYPIFNKSKDLSNIDKKVDEWKNNCHTWCEYQCGSAPDQSKIKCRNEKCVEI